MHELRVVRMSIERSLEIAVAQIPGVTRPEEVPIIERARSRMNQIIIRSQEWETFGSIPRPEWGWDPHRQVIALESERLEGETVTASGQR